MEYHLDCSLAKKRLDSLDMFTLAYIEAMMWTLTDEEGNSLDYLGLHDIAEEAIEKCKADCLTFREQVSGLLDGANEVQAGHDFWLTRNRHGAGFWDRDAETYPNDVNGRELTQWAYSFGEVYAYMGDDGMVYVN